MQEQQQPVTEKRWQDYLDYNFSLFVAQAIGARPNACFDNVLSLFATCAPYVLDSQGVLVEGWYVVDLKDEVVLNEHGWYEFPDGKILDPTLVLLAPRKQPVYYFPAIKRSWQEVYEIIQKEGDIWFPYVRCVGTYGENGLAHPFYRAAYEAAKEKVLSLAIAQWPPKQMTFLTAQDPEHDEQDLAMRIQVHFGFPKPDQEEKGRPEPDQEEQGQ